MAVLYDLTLYSSPNGDYREGYSIGLFRTQEDADAVAARYLREVPGFCDHPCDIEITQVPILGDAVRDVYRFVGWNVNEEFDEIDIVQGPCYASSVQAQADYEKAQVETPRQEWALNRWAIGHCDWEYGFVRE